jgi:hypothetical protein
MKNQYSLFLLLLFPLLFACEEDEDKTIQTDLTMEASQLFDISNSWGESLYFAMLRWEDYQTVNPSDLPGCPKIALEQSLKQVTLEFLPDSACIKTGQTIRSGKIILDYSPENLSTQNWTLEYQNYTINQDSLEGTRKFSRSDFNKVSEQFENLILKTNNGVNSTFSGNLNHTTISLRLELIGISSLGTITGTNPAGRKFTTELTDPRQILVSCSKENEILPISGKESWTVARGSSKNVIHQINYESTGNCQVNATVTLADGRSLVLTL